MVKSSPATFAMIKPDGTRQGLLPAILGMALNAGLIPAAMMEISCMRVQDVEFLYGHVKEKYPDVWPGLLEFTRSGPCYGIIFRPRETGTCAVTLWRNLMGSTKSWEAPEGTIRAKWGNKSICHENVVHGSDSRERAEEEIEHFFHDDPRI